MISSPWSPWYDFMIADMLPQDMNGKQSANQGLSGVGYNMLITHHRECARRTRQAFQRVDFGAAIESAQIECHR